MSKAFILSTNVINKLMKLEKKFGKEKFDDLTLYICE